jgi:flagellar hook assembly protein FlgD
VTQLRVLPNVVSPNGDGVGDTAKISYFLSTSAPVTMTLSDAAGHQLATLFSGIVSQGSQTFEWKQVGIADGRYTVTITAGSATGKRVTNRAVFYVDRTLAQPKLSLPAFSPNGDGLFDTTALSFRLDAAASVRVELWRTTKLVGTLVNEALGAGPAQVAWDGRLGAKPVPDGAYQLVLKVKDAVTTSTQTFPVVVDTTAPRLRLVSRARVRFWTNEPATITAMVGARRATKHVRAGYFTLPVLRGARHFTVTATDAVGNKAPPLRF